VSRKYVVLVVTTLVVVLLDQWTKAYIAQTLPLHQSWDVLPGLFNITHIRNPGAAFGFLAGASPRFRILFFIAITLLALGLILYYLYQATEAEGFQAACLSLIFAGAAGNLIDRVRFGEVVDFLDVHWGVHHWPAFNVADAAISAGAILLVLALIREGRAKA